MYTGKITRLLIVEDDEDDFFLLESVLKKISFKKNITWANSFKEAINILEANSFDLLLIDYQLGPHTGLELVSFINKNFPFIPTILLTGLKESTIDQEALASGVYDYLAKDQYTAESLSRSIRYAIEKSKVLKSLKESENKFKNLFENAVEYIFLIDSDYLVIDANKAALKLFNYDKKDEIIELNILHYISPGIFVIEDHINSSVEVEFSISELNKKCFCILNISIVDTEKKIYQLALHDITERKVNEQREKLLEKQALTGKVARVIAHEIKNPLTNIHLSLVELKSVLQDAQIKNKDENPGEFLDIIDRNGKRINALIEDLLNATRFDTMNVREIRIHEVLYETLALIRDRAKLKNVHIEKNIQEDLVIKGDKEKLIIAFLNILVNAIEAVNEKEGQLQVITSCLDEEINIMIGDNGKGIPPQYLSNLFEPFFTSKKGGTGLGLTATYNIISKHDGSVKVTSTVGKGTTFIVTLPVKI